MDPRVVFSLLFAIALIFCIYTNIIVFARESTLPSDFVWAEVSSALTAAFLSVLLSLTIAKLAKRHKFLCPYGCNNILKVYEKGISHQINHVKCKKNSCKGLIQYYFDSCSNFFYSKEGMIEFKCQICDSRITISTKSGTNPGRLRICEWCLHKIKFDHKLLKLIFIGKRLFMEDFEEIDRAAATGFFDCTGLNCFKRFRPDLSVNRYEINDVFYCPTCSKAYRVKD